MIPRYYRTVALVARISHYSEMVLVCTFPAASDLKQMAFEKSDLEPQGGQPKGESDRVSTKAFSYVL